jgi:hypothetical protein
MFCSSPLTGEDTGEGEKDERPPSLCLSPAKGREDPKSNAAVLILHILACRSYSSAAECEIARATSNDAVDGIGATAGKSAKAWQMLTENHGWVTDLSQIPQMGCTLWTLFPAFS